VRPAGHDGEQNEADVKRRRTRNGLSGVREIANDPAPMSKLET